MSNINIEDVNLRLTETRNELSEEDSRLWGGLENERLARNAGDDANKSLALQVQDTVSGTERRLSTEVIHREQGDLDKLGLLNQLSQSMSDYRIKTDKEIEAERFARDILGINLDARITTAEASFNHKELKLYQDIQEVFTNLDGKYTSMDSRIKKYEEMLQDITMDSIKITMDNGEINMGAWTILSQAREWDLEILAKMRGFQEKTTEDVNQALEELQNQLPITENIINEIMESLSDSPLIAELRDALNEGIDTTESLELKLAQEEAARAKAMIDLAYANAQALAAEKAALAESLAAESQARADEVQEEANRRIESIRQIREDIGQEVDLINGQIATDIGLIKTELKDAKDGFNSSIEEVRGETDVVLNELTTYKASNDVAVAGLVSKVNTNVTNTAANASKIEGLTSELATTNTELGKVRNTSATALSKADTAVSANSALANRVDALAASITDLGEGAETTVDVNAFNALKAEVETNASGVSSLVEQVNALGTNYSNLDDGLTANTEAVSSLVVKQSEMNGDISQLASDVTYLTSELGVLDAAIDANVSAISNTNTELSKVNGKITAANEAATLLTGRVSNVEGEITKKADASALSSLTTRVDSVEGKYTSQASDITQLSNSLDTTNLNVGTAQTAAQNAMTAAGAKGKVIFGNTAPAVEDRLVQNLWIDTTGNANTPKRWNGSAWVVVTDKVATDAANAVSALDTVVRTKADVSALNSLTTKVSDEAGKTTANTNSITTLNSDIVRINNDLSTKANASALNDIYTKQQTDSKALSTAAGEISKYDATLSIGGANLQAGTQTISGFMYYGPFHTITKVDGLARTDIVRTVKTVTTAQGIAASVPNRNMVLQVGKKYVISFLARGTAIPNYIYVMSSTATGTNHSVSFTRDGTFNETTFVKFTGIFTAVADRTTAYMMIASNGSAVGAWFDVAEVMFQEGSKATPWEPSYLDVQSQLDTNATAITNINAEISRVDGRVTTESNRTTTLTGRVDTVENGLSLKANVTALNNIYTKSESDAKATSLAAGEVSKYDANLVIGGSNLLNGTATLSNTEETYKGGKIYRQYRTAAEADTHDFIVNVVDLDAGDYTLSFDIKASIDVPSMSSNLSYFYSPNTTTKIVTSQGYTAYNSDGRAEKRVTTSWQRIWITWSQSSATPYKNIIINRIYGIGIDYTVDIANVKFEKGNKATAWTPANSDTQNALNANANAISQTNATVNALEGVVSSHSVSINSLSNEVLNLNTNTTNISDAVSLLSSKVDSTEDSITSQASNIVKLDAAIKASTASDNLIPNPTFDSAYDQMGYTVVPSTNSEVPSNCPYRFVAKLNSRDNVPNIEDIACTAGDVYEISAYVACAQGVHGFNLMVVEKDFKDGNIIGFPSGGGLAPTSVWTKRVWRWTVRDGVTFFRPLLQIDTFDNSTVWYATNWKVTNISAAAKAQTTADATANTLVSTNATVSQQGDQIIANTESIQSAESRLANNEASIQSIQSTYATKDSVGSLAQTALKSVWQNDITKAVSDISVGGVNLLTNTAYLSASNPPQVLGGSGYFLSGLNPGYHAGTSSTGENHFVIDNVYAERYIRIHAAVSNTSTLKPNSTYTFSLKIRGAAKPLGFRIIVRINGVFTDLPIKMIEYENDVFSTHGCTFTIPSGTTDIIISLQSYSVNLGESFAIQNSSMKLEEGNVVTAWTIAQEEVQAQLVASTTAINTLDTKVGHVDGRVSAQAEQLLVLTSDNTANKNALQVQAKVIDGVQASYMVKMESNGVIGGFGMIQESGALGVVTTVFGVNADGFFIGAPAGGKKPFIVSSYPQIINGVSYPAGTYIDTALIADATIGNAKIANLDAGKINVGILSADRIASKSISADKLVVGSGANMYGDQYNLRGTQGWAGSVTSDYDVVVTGNALSLSGRDHIGPVDLDIPIRVGETYVIEVVATRTIGNLGLNAGFWYQKADKHLTPIPYHSVGSLTSTVVYGGWAKYTYHITVSEGGGDIFNRPAYGRLYFMIDQAASGGSTTWRVGDIKVMRAVENALVVHGGITADKLAANSVTADKLSASAIETISLSARNGTFTAPDGSKTVINGGLTEVYYPGNKIAIRIGVR